MVKELFGLQTSLGSDKITLPGAAAGRSRRRGSRERGVESESRASLGGFLETIRYFSFILRLY